MTQSLLRRRRGGGRAPESIEQRIIFLDFVPAKAYIGRKTFFDIVEFAAGPVRRKGGACPSRHLAGSRIVTAAKARADPKFVDLRSRPLTLPRLCRGPLPLPEEREQPTDLSIFSHLLGEREGPAKREGEGLGCCIPHLRAPTFAPLTQDSRKFLLINENIELVTTF